MVSFKPHIYTENDLRLAERVCHQIAGAIANAQLFIEAKSVEKVLREARDELEIRVQERTVELDERARLWFFIGLGHILVEGDIPKGIWACQNAYSIFKQLKNIDLQAYALTFSTFGSVLLGEFSLAEKTLKKIESIVEKSDDSELKAIQLMVQCLLANHRGDFRKTQGLVEKLQKKIERHGFVYMVPWTFEILGYLKVAQEEFSEAEKIGKQYLSTAIYLKNGLFRGLAFRLLGLIYLHMNDFERAREAIDQSIVIFSKETPSKYHLNRSRIKMGLVCSNLKEYRRAEEELREALQYFSSISSYISLAEVHFATALLKQDQGKKDEAATHLRTGFKIAEERKYEHFYNLGTNYLMKLCLLALKLKVEEAMDYTAHLLSTRLSPIAEEGLRGLSNHRDSKVREKIWEIRRRVHRSKVPRLRIETLGGFRIFLNGLPIKESEWDRHQPKQLLMSIVAHVHEGQGIPIEHFIDDLWSDTETETGERNFKVTLHRLRKVLEPTMKQEYGSSYIHLKNNLISLDLELCQVDIGEFLSLIKRGNEREKEEDIKGALSFYTEAMEQYRGDPLFEDFNSSSFELKREELKGKYIELLFRIATLYEKQGVLKKTISFYKQVLQANPFLEEAYEKLMILYSNRGMRSDAIRLYENYTKSCGDYPGWKPDPLIVSLYNRIL